jgi:hypothetical protein
MVSVISRDPTSAAWLLQQPENRGHANVHPLDRAGDRQRRNHERCSRWRSRCRGQQCQLCQPGAGAIRGALEEALGDHIGPIVDSLNVAAAEALAAYNPPPPPGHEEGKGMRRRLAGRGARRTQRRTLSRAWTGRRSSSFSGKIFPRGAPRGHLRGVYK